LRKPGEFPAAIAFLLPATPASDSFRRLFLDLSPRLPEDLVVLVTSDLSQLARFPPLPSNSSALLLSACEDRVSIGPLHVPGNSVCFSCLHHWIATAGFDRIERPGPPGDAEARLAARLLGDAAEFPPDAFTNHLTTCLVAVDTQTEQYSSHPIFPLRNCPLCSGIEPAGWPGLRIHCSPLTGIVQSMQITTEPAAGAWRADATWASPLPVADARPLLARQQSHGRGSNREAAETGCIAEALERYSLIYRGDEPLRRARIHEIGGIHPAAILLYSERQYQNRHAWNRAVDERFFVGEPFDPDRPIDWFPATDLVTGAPAFVPAAITLMWYRFQPGEPEYARADSIGCATGPTFDDAVGRALLEWIERDAMAIWWYNQARRPCVRLDSFESPELQTVRQGLLRIGRDLVLLDCTTDTGIPTYVAVAARSDGTEPLVAGASHPSPRVAAWKAASEPGQMWFSMMRTGTIDDGLREWVSRANPASLPYLAPTHEIDASPEPPPMSPAEQVALIVDRLRKAGLRPYAVDLSRPDVSLPAVRAVVPGLRHVWNRRGPGRLYDVPFHLGWVDAPLGEDDLNSICCMI
jgi:bacteriocin biosynthesis cyclodehydratase domain-containing protein